jgi:hypothetical protein
VSARLAVAVLVAALLAAIAQPVAAAPLLDDADATELAQSLADATEEQDVCYGWQVRVQDDSGGPSGLDIGSSLGPGRPVGAAVGSCDRSVVLEGSVHYSCESCESEDSSSIRVTANFPGAPTERDLADLGLEGGDLTKDTGDVVLVNMAGALPLIVASKGAAAPVPVEPSTVTPAASGHPTDGPQIPDWLRERWLALAALLVVIVGGVIWLLKVVDDERRLRHVDRPRPADRYTDTTS